MIGVLVRAAALAAMYLLVLTSVDPGDILVGVVLGLVLAGALRARRGRARRIDFGGVADRVRAAIGLAAATSREVVVGTWRVVRFCLGWEANPGFVEIPREGRSRRSVALWGVLTGEAPDEVPIDVDEARDVLVVHLVDAGDPDAVRARHHRRAERWQRRVVT